MGAAGWECRGMEVPRDGSAARCECRVDLIIHDMTGIQNGAGQDFPFEERAYLLPGAGCVRESG